MMASGTTNLRSKRAHRLAVACAGIGLVAFLSGCDGGPASSGFTNADATTQSSAPTSASSASSATTAASSTSATTTASTTASIAPSTAPTAVTPTTIVGSGVDVTRSYPLSGFRAIDVAAFTLTVTRGDTFAVSVTADDNVFDRLVVDVRTGTLRLGIANQTSLRQVTLRAEVTMPELDALDSAGNATVTMRGFSSDILRTIDLSGASHLDADLHSSQLRLTASGASNVVLRGSATELQVDLGGASNTTATDFAVVNADVSLSGASRAQLQVTGQIRSAELSGASTLRYGGGGAVSGVQTSGGSTISRG